MKYVSLAYIDEKRFEALTGSEQDAMRDVCFAYIDWLKETGHFAGGELLQSARYATTLRKNDGRVSVPALDAERGAGAERGRKSIAHECETVVVRHLTFVEARSIVLDRDAGSAVGADDPYHNPRAATAWRYRVLDAVLDHCLHGHTWQSDIAEPVGGRQLVSKPVSKSDPFDFKVIANRPQLVG